MVHTLHHVTFFGRILVLYHCSQTGYFKKNKKQKIQWDVINRIAHGISDLNHGIKSSLSCVIVRVIFVLFLKSRNRTLKKLQNHIFLSIFRCQALFSNSLRRFFVCRSSGQVNIGSIWECICTEVNLLLLF